MSNIRTPDLRDFDLRYPFLLVIITTLFAFILSFVKPINNFAQQPEQITGTSFTEEILE